MYTLFDTVHTVATDLAVAGYTADARTAAVPAPFRLWFDLVPCALVHSRCGKFSVIVIWPEESQLVPTRGPPDVIRAGAPTAFTIDVEVSFTVDF
jgi:hypothetical protein